MNLGIDPGDFHKKILLGVCNQYRKQADMICNVLTFQMQAYYLKIRRSDTPGSDRTIFLVLHRFKGM